MYCTFHLPTRSAEAVDGRAPSKGGKGSTTQGPSSLASASGPGIAIPVHALPCPPAFDPSFQSIALSVTAGHSCLAAAGAVPLFVAEVDAALLAACSGAELAAWQAQPALALTAAHGPAARDVHAGSAAAASAAAEAANAAGAAGEALPVAHAVPPVATATDTLSPAGSAASGLSSGGATSRTSTSLSRTHVAADAILASLT